MRLRPPAESKSPERLLPARPRHEAVYSRMAIQIAHDHIQPELNSWYQSLYSEEGAWCCDGTDVTRLTDPQWMIKDGQYQGVSGK